MATSSAVIANLALGHLGVRGRITTLSSDVTSEGVICNTFYARALSETLRAAPWHCARRFADLTLISTLSDGTGWSTLREWTYSYLVPEDCLQPLRLHWGGRRNPNTAQEVPYELYADLDSTAYDAAVTYATGDYAQSVAIWYRALRETINDTPASSASDWVAVTRPPMLLYTDAESARLEYTYNLTDTTRFDVDFESALAALLAFYIAPSVTVNGSADMLRQQVAGTYDVLVSQARANDYNARKRDVPPASSYESIRATGIR